MSFRILIVDDAAFIREALIQICRETGHQVIGEAADGTEAVNQAFTLRPDVIIMDMVMPQKNGLEAAQDILEKLPKIKIIACSTVDQEFLMKKALQVGCLSYITKPFKKSDIVEALRFLQRDSDAPRRKDG